MGDCFESAELDRELELKKDISCDLRCLSSPMR